MPSSCDPEHKYKLQTIYTYMYTITCTMYPLCDNELWMQRRKLL